MRNPPTPALVIDAAVVERNARRLADYAAAHRLAVRPHVKTHKSLRLAELQLAAGAAGLTVAKVGEAEVMAEVSADLLVAYPAVDAWRTNRLARLARKRTVRVAVDTAAAVAALSDAAQAEDTTLGVLVDLDVGLGRTGVQSPGAALELAQAIDRSPALRLDGLFSYPGHVTQAAATQAAPLARVAELLEETRQLWQRHSLPAAIVSGGSTPTAFQSHLVPQWTEIRPGTYLLNDLTIVRGGFCGLEDCAARIECTVVSDAVPGQVVIDAGSKALTSDRNPYDPEGGFGLVVEYPAARISRLTEEHGQVDVRGCGERPRVGERVSVVPNHICPCVNLHDQFWWREPDGTSLLPVDARGRLS